MVSFRSLYSESKVGISRALDNIGRCHARLGQFAQAIDSWIEKLPLSKTPLETTWLHHEIGRCYLEQKNYQDALECGQRSLASAQEAQEKVWELNATVLIAQSQGRSPFVELILGYITHHCIVNSLSLSKLVDKPRTSKSHLFSSKAFKQ